jgi:parallel beta-helix repeat protein
MKNTAAVVAAAVIGMAVAPVSAAPVPSQTRPAEIRVGIEEGDLRGTDHRALQAAVDYVAGLGGGTVHIGPGRYVMRNALTLRDDVRIVGVPGKTVLAAADGARSVLASDGDCNERQITLADTTGFRVGDGVAISDESQGGGFGVTTATLTAQLDARTFRISAPLYFDYMVAQKASARRAFPIVGGWQVKNVLLEGLTIEGNRGKTEPLDGCRGGGIYLFESENVTIRRCIVRGYNGDGISFQVSSRVTVEDCLAENNAGLGLHPGSGSQHPVLRRNRSVGNGGDGLYVCWRVKHGLFEGNEVRENHGVGISIGHKDTDNMFRGNTITGNGKAGVLFRSESEAMGAHRNTFERNVILDNGVSETGSLAGAAVVIHGPHHDLVFRKNRIGHSKRPPTARAGIRTSQQARGLKADDNDFRHVSTPIEAAK